MLLKRLISYEVRCQVKHGKKKALDSDRPGVDPACDSLATMQEERELVPKDFYLKEGDFGFSAKITAALNAMDINSRVAMVKKSSNMVCIVSVCLLINRVYLHASVLHNCAAWM